MNQALYFDGASGLSVKEYSPQRHRVRRLFTPRPEPVLSDVEGRLCGAISESCFIRLHGYRFAQHTK